MIAGYQRIPVWRWMYQYGYGRALALAPALSAHLYRLTGSLIFFSSSLFLTVLFPFPSRPRNAHDFPFVFSALSLSPPSRVDLTVDHAHTVSESTFFLSFQPLHDRPLPLWMSILSFKNS